MVIAPGTGRVGFQPVWLQIALTQCFAKFNGVSEFGGHYNQDDSILVSTLGPAFYGNSQVLLQYQNLARDFCTSRMILPEAC